MPIFQPNERWQADTTHWQIADGTEVEILNILDDHSRLAIACVTRTTFKAGDVVDVFHHGFERHGAVRSWGHDPERRRRPRVVN